MNTLSQEKITDGLRTEFVAQRVLHFRSVSSTNTIAKEEAAKGAPEGTLVIAEEQTVGKGRLDRRWIAPAETSLLMSLIFYPDLRPAQAARLTMVCALGAANGIEEILDLSVTFKWPNDILVDKKKTGGILTEIEARKDQLAYIVIGIGLNVNFDPNQIPGLPSNATSLSQAMGHDLPRLPLLQAILRNIEDWYLRMQEGKTVHEAWAERMSTLGSRVRVTTPQEEETGFAQALDADGALLLRRDDDQLVRIVAGDVSLRVTAEEN